MAIVNLEATSLLGKQVILTHRFEGTDFEHRGTVIAVVQVLAGSRAAPSLMLEEDSTRCDYFDLDEVTIHTLL